jgi:hypothetical protein
MEAVCFFYPVQRGLLNSIEPKFLPLEADRETQSQFISWSQNRHDFQEEMLNKPPKINAEKWQKNYYQGIDLFGKSKVDDHQTKLRLKQFHSLSD